MEGVENAVAGPSQRVNGMAAAGALGGSPVRAGLNARNGRSGSQDPLSHTYGRLNGTASPASHARPSNSNGASTTANTTPTASASAAFLTTPLSPAAMPEPPFLVRAKFDFEATDASALSFSTGDLIVVITMLESGWWDGMLGDDRGWFPSNFVELASEEDEAELEEEYRALDEARAQAQAGGATENLTATEQNQAGPSRDRKNRRTILAEDVMRIDDVMGTGWEAGAGGADSLEALARSMGVGADDMAMGHDDADDNDGADEFMVAARRQRERTDTIDSMSMSMYMSSTSMAGPSRSMGESAPITSGENATLGRSVGISADKDFGAGLRGAASRRREREDTAGTIRPSPAIAGVGRMHTPPDPGSAVRENTPKGRGRVRNSVGSSLSGMSGRRGGTGGQDDAWIPCLTPDGQVYYHNTQTGEDSWDLPSNAADMYDDDEEHEDDLEAYYPSPSSGHPSSTFPTQPTIPDPGGNDFRPPPNVTAEIPYPWISRLSDDGQQWFYVNRLTGETSTTPPSGSRNAKGDQLAASISGLAVGDVPPPARTRRQSLEVRQKAMTDWTRRSKHKVEIALRPAGKSSLGIMLDIINDTLREVFEAAVAGSAAEEEKSRASDFQSQSVYLAAVSREESAIESLRTSHGELLGAITDLLRAFGYVGPIDKLEEMPRPAWTSDLTLIGSIGVFSANVHAATRSKRQPENGMSVWQEVMRSGNKLRDVITDIPDVATEGAVLGKPLWSWVGVEDVGVMCSGQWGFGESLEMGRKLDQGVIDELDEIRAKLDSARQTTDGQGEDALEIVRLVECFRSVVLDVDIAIAIDIDGDLERTKANLDDSQRYLDLIRRARTELDGLINSTANLGDIATDIYLAASRDEAIAPLTDSLIKIFIICTDTISKLLSISSEQRVMTQQTAIESRIGIRSPRYVPTPSTKARPLSTKSQASRASRGSRASAVEAKRNRVRGIEDDFQDSEERLGDRAAAESERDPSGRLPLRQQSLPTHSHAQHRPNRDSAGTSASISPVSASTSQVSLARAGADPRTALGRSVSGRQRGHQHHPSATSSNTSLAYQKTERTESDSGSMRGSHRASSLMKGFFGRNRADSDAELRERAAEKAEKARNKEKGVRKLAKLLGEDVSHIPQIAAVRAPPPQAQRQFPNQYEDNRTPPSASFASIQSAPIVEAPWYLAEDYAPEEIVSDDKGGVKAGTLRALVVKLTPHGSTDTSFFQAFMLTFRSFTDTEQLLDMLFARYTMQPPEDLDPAQEAEWIKLKQTPIRLRVANVLRAWLDVHFLHEQDMDKLDKIEHFATDTMIDSIGSEMLSMLSKTLLNLIQRRRRGEDLNQRRIISGGTLSPPAPLLPRSSGKQLQLTDIAPLEFARQLTIIEFGNFQRVRAAECLHKQWTGDDESRAKNIRSVIQTANKLAAWIGLLVLQPKEPKSRASLMKFFIQTAVELRSMNNFSSMAALIAGLNAAPVDRLKRTKEHLSAKTLAMKDDLDKTMDSSKNFANYKDILKTINPPCVPFLGFYLSALTFIEDGNKDIYNPAANRGMTNSVSNSSLASSAHGHLAGRGPTSASSSRTPIQPLTASTSGTVQGTESSPATNPNTASTAPEPPKEPLINFFKRSLTAEVIRDIQQYQSQPYNLAKCRPVHEFIITGLKMMDEHKGDLYDRSLLLEPREREEERITRMLHDSGFI